MRSSAFWSIAASTWGRFFFAPGGRGDDDENDEEEVNDEDGGGQNFGVSEVYELF